MCIRDRPVPHPAQSHTAGAPRPPCKRGWLQTPPALAPADARPPLGAGDAGWSRPFALAGAQLRFPFGRTCAAVA
eukprot:8473244-Alexandrium_andersonii.AAC.1